MARKATGG